MFPDNEIVLTINLKDWRKVRLMHPFWFTSTDGTQHKVPSNTESDLGSIPRALWAVLPPHRFRASYIMHDYNYQTGKLPRKEVDRLLYECIRCEGGGYLIAKMIYLAVRLFGWMAWNGHRKA